MPSMSWSLTWSRRETSLLQKLSPGLQFYSAESSTRTKMKPPIDKSGTSAGSMGDQVGCRASSPSFRAIILKLSLRSSS